MPEKQLTNEELVALGRRVLEARERQKAADRRRRKITGVLYEMWKAGNRTPIGDIKA